MIQRDSPKVSVARQCGLLGVNRSSLYFTPSPKADPRLPLTSAIDRIHLEHPFMGSRQMTRALRTEGFLVHRSRVQRLLQLMDICSMAPGPHTSRKHPVTAMTPLFTGQRSHTTSGSASMVPKGRGSPPEQPPAAPQSAELLTRGHELISLSARLR
jgi:hypothetical protein